MPIHNRYHTTTNNSSNLPTSPTNNNNNNNLPSHNVVYSPPPLPLPQQFITTYELWVFNISNKSLLDFSHLSNTNRNDFSKINKGLYQQCFTSSTQIPTGYQRKFIEFSFNSNFQLYDGIDCRSGVQHFLFGF
ncbi:hypothetical protein ACTFIW_008745 [Dictyostelium discoideum]